jgi:HEPN domain-containing protein
MIAATILAYDAVPLQADAAQYRAVAVALAQSAELLVRAALEVNTIGPEWCDSVTAWNREAHDLLERSLAFHERAYEAECRAREQAVP